MTEPRDCFHCGLPVPKNTRFQLVYEGQQQDFCCPGCLAVAETIIGGGLEDYYRHRDNFSELADTGEHNYTLFDQAEFQEGFVSHRKGGQTARISLGGISCAACVWLIEQRLNSIDGVEQATVNLTQHRLLIDYDEETVPLSAIFNAITNIGYTPSPFSSSGEEDLLKAENNTALRRLGIAGIGMMQVGMYAIALHAGSLQGIADEQRDFLRIVSALVATVVIIAAAKPFFINAWRAITTRSLTMDVPVALAIGLAYVASCWATWRGTGDVYFDSVSMFTFFLLLGRYLELRARHFNRRSVADVQSHMPQAAWLLTDDGKLAQIAVKQLEVGQVIVVKAGERIPADGTIIAGASAVDESSLSGEYLPVDKVLGDAVVAGSINTDNTLQLRIDAIGDDSQLATIDRLLDRAQQQKPAIAKLADRLSSMFVAQVLIISVGVYIFWYFHAPEQALWVALSVLVVSCPCALSLATPTTLTAATASLRERGLLISRGHVLESLIKSDIIVFDKTGTLTSGSLQRVAQHHYGNGSHDENIALYVAAALEEHSNHPVAKAFANTGGELTAHDIDIVASKGISGTVNDTRYRIGCLAFIEQSLGELDLPCNDSNYQRIYLADERQLIAHFDLDDYIRAEASTTIQALQTMGKEVVLLSGDPSNAVQIVANALAIREAHGAQSPADKLRYIEQRQQQGRHITMIGDGINDVPVLAGADVSIAMTQAADLARTSADCMLMNNNLSNIIKLIRTAERSKKIIRQNFAWSLGYNVLTVPLAAAGLIPPYIAVIGMSLSSLIVVGNALRLLKQED
ncbi:Cu2+-exporting ATPase [Sinobacterium caligoides]|uniref:Cu2+-exporting ATPase n=1 Tax=Sinobacterium caligoides TaxID=933926 RepID=A0A3N2E0V5_9GAMM|nr:heavy metal translocating P-type ATPase [Sinobacterium caligoides]ROS05269.1 Cu2+-exporting ATPase [Sinobacterium caligoides]